MTHPAPGDAEIVERRAKPKRIEKVCPHCAATYLPSRYYDNRFCSSDCYHAWSRQKPTQETIYRWSIPEPNSGCWLWTASITDAGYGTLSIGRKLWGAHRLSFMVFSHLETLPDHLVVRHSCDNRACVNPDHLLAGTPADNSRDAVKRDRMERGSKRYNAKLRESDIPDIRLLLASSTPVAEIARQFSVSPRCIYFIRNGERWTRD